MNFSSNAVNLDDCAREPIHIPGSIQPHGLIFVLREPDLTVVQVSENVLAFLGLAADQLLECELSVFLSAEQLSRVRFALNSVDPRDNNPVNLVLETKNGRRPLDGFVHRHDGFSFLELEPASLSDQARFLDFYKSISRLATRLHTTEELKSLLNEAAEGIREVTGFERVMIYRFADNFEGQVVAEAKGDFYDSFLGLWFPASDIPEQARQLYVVNPIRAILDSSYVPAHIVPAINPDSNRPVDLSYAGLRSVSALHCEYLRNMGVVASMSISILREGRLWGLVACHHPEAKLVAYELRKACTFVGQILSSEIARREAEAESRYRSSSTLVQAKFLEQMAGSPDPWLGLIQSSPNLMDMVPCEGAATVVGDAANMLGSTPSYTDLMEILRILRSSDAGSTFITHSLKNHFPVSEGMRKTASGLIALEISRTPESYILFFRPELPQTVSWGGDPNKPVLPSEDGFRLSPRKSFETWKEQVRGYSQPWTSSEMQTAVELRNLVSVVLFGKGDGKN